MRVESAATAEKHRGAGETAGGLPGGGQRGVQLGPNAIGGHHFVVSLHGGHAIPSNSACLQTPEDPVSGGEGHHQAVELHGSHLWGVGQAAVSETSQGAGPRARAGFRPPTSTL